MDPTQLLLTIVLTLTTILLIIVGIQLIFVLREVRKTLRNINAIVEGFENVSVGLEHGLTEVVGFVNGFKTILKILTTFNHKNRK